LVLGDESMTEVSHQKKKMFRFPFPLPIHAQKATPPELQEKN
jgi:hypothetical protein